MNVSIVEGDGRHPIGDDALYKSDLCNGKKMLVILPNIGKFAAVQLSLPIYKVDIEGTVWTFLMVVPSNRNSFIGSFIC